MKKWEITYEVGDNEKIVSVTANSAEKAMRLGEEKISKQAKGKDYKFSRLKKVEDNDELD